MVSSFFFTQPEPTTYMYTKDLNNGISDEPFDDSMDMRTLPTRKPKLCKIGRVQGQSKVKL